MAGPPGLAFDIPCWASGAGEAAVVGAGAVAVGVAATALAVDYVLDEPALGYAPLYPQAGISDGNLSITIPVAGSTTLTTGGVPLTAEDGSSLNGVTAIDNPLQQLIDPLPVSASQENILRATTLQTGGHTLTNRTLKELGLTKEQGKQAIEALKDALGLPNNFHNKIMSDGDVVESSTGEVLGNLYDYVD